MKKLLIVALACCPAVVTLACASAGKQTHQEVHDAKSVRLHVFGLMCRASCGARATAAIESVSGAKVVEIGEIDMPTRSAWFRIEGSADTKAMIAALEEASYSAKVE
jgi:hypothetical protein